MGGDSACVLPVERFTATSCAGGLSPKENRGDNRQRHRLICRGHLPGAAPKAAPTSIGWGGTRCGRLGAPVPWRPSADKPNVGGARGWDHRRGGGAAPIVVRWCCQRLWHGESPPPVERRHLQAHAPRQVATPSALYSRSCPRGAPRLGFFTHSSRRDADDTANAVSPHRTCRRGAGRRGNGGRHATG